MKTKLISLVMVSLILFLGNTYVGNFYSYLPNEYYKVFPSPMETNSIGSVFGIYTSDYFQIETAITTHPTNPNIMLGAAISGEPYVISSFPYEGYRTGAYVTTNGGINWTGYNSIRDLTGDTINTFGDETVIIDKDGTFIIPYISIGHKVGVSRSTNNGVNWSQTITVPGVNEADKISSTTDGIPTSPYYGRSYLVFTDHPDGPYGTYFSYTTNNGSNWSSIQRISPEANSRRLGATISVGPNGEVYSCWRYVDFLGFAKSTNGGVNWTSSDDVDTMHFAGNAQGIFTLNGALVNGLSVMDVDKTGGPRNGWIYIVSTEIKEPTVSPALYNYDLILRRSTNGGVNWSAFRVNQDDAGSFRYHFFQCINIDKNGGINIVYYDGRNTPPNTNNDSFQVYISRSVDGGNTFEDKLISGSKFKHKPIPNLYGLQNYAGSYIGVTSGNNTVWPLWYDDHTGEHKAYSSKITLTMNLTAIPEGFYNISSDKLNSKDTIRAYLRNSTTPYARVDSAKGVIDSLTFTTPIIFINANQGNYYLEAVHRNSITTWSGGTIAYSVIPDENYDFTTDSTKAYGENMIKVDGNWCFYSGDVDKNGYIDGTDFILVYNDANNSVDGYVSTDVNGDGFVDLTDVIIVYNHSSEFIGVISP